jgi:hypothetical protein
MITETSCTLVGCILQSATTLNRILSLGAQTMEVSRHRHEGLLFICPATTAITASRLQVSFHLNDF